MASEKLLYNTGSSSWRSMTTQRGRMEQEVGGRWHMYTYDGFTLLYGRNQHNIVKKYTHGGCMLMYGKTNTIL